MFWHVKPDEFGEESRAKDIHGVAYSLVETCQTIADRYNTVCIKPTCVEVDPSGLGIAVYDILTDLKVPCKLRKSIKTRMGSADVFTVDEYW